MHRGTVKWFNAEKGFGFIQTEEDEEVFVHSSALDHLETLEEGQKVTFEVRDTEHGKIATNVKEVD